MSQLNVALVCTTLVVVKFVASAQTAGYGQQLEAQRGAGALEQQGFGTMGNLLRGEQGAYGVDGAAGGAREGGAGGMAVHRLWDHRLPDQQGGKSRMTVEKAFW